MTVKLFKVSKYRAVPTVVDGIRFASRLEAKRYDELKLLEKAGLIKRLSTQERFPLKYQAVVLGHYVADFYYYDTQQNEWIVEDVKGRRLPLYIWKAKHFEAQYGRKIVEVFK